MVPIDSFERGCHSQRNEALGSGGSLVLLPGEIKHGEKMSFFELKDQSPRLLSIQYWFFYLLILHMAPTISEGEKEIHY
jgi:hypothetical protein